MLVNWAEVPFSAPGARLVRGWDLAATKPRTASSDPDWTVGLLAVACDGEVWLCDVVRWRETPARSHQLVWDQWLTDAERTGLSVPYRIEKEGGSGGGFTAAAFRSDLARRWRELTAGDPDIVNRLSPPDVQSVPVAKSKAVRARRVAVLAQRGFVHVVDGPWLDAFLDELESFPDPKVHDDQVDAMSLAVAQVLDGRTVTGAPEGVGRSADPSLADRLAAPPRRRRARVSLTN